MVSSNLLIVLIASAAPSVFGLASFSSKIPNGVAMGKSLGHAGSDYTAFGTLFSKSGKSWAAVCSQPWPESASVTVGAVLGDPCCKWTSGKPDFTLSAPNLSGTVCASAAAAAPAPAPAAAPPAAATPLMAPGAPPAVLLNAAAPKGKGEVLCDAA